jgi:hypothetical protein
VGWVASLANSMAKGALETEPKAASLVTLMDDEEVYQIEGTSAAGEDLTVYVTPTGEIMESGTEQGGGSD